MVSCIVCSKVVSGARIKYYQSIGEKPLCYKCQQARCLNRYEVIKALIKDQKLNKSFDEYKRYWAK